MGTSGQLGAMQWMSFGLSFLVVLLAIGAVYFLFHRFVLGTMPRRVEPRMKIVESLAVGPRQKVVLLRLGQREVLIGVTAQQMNALGNWTLAPSSLAAAVAEEPAEVAGKTEQVKTFQSMLGAMNFRAGRNQDKRV